MVSDTFAAMLTLPFTGDTGNTPSPPPGERAEVRWFVAVGTGTMALAPGMPFAQPMGEGVGRTDEGNGSGFGRGWRSRVRVVGKNSALKHGRNSTGVELDTAYCKLAASRLMNENPSLFGNAQLQIDLKRTRPLSRLPFYMNHRRVTGRTNEEVRRAEKTRVLEKSEE